MIVNIMFMNIKYYFKKVSTVTVEQSDFGLL